MVKNFLFITSCVCLSTNQSFLYFCFSSFFPLKTSILASSVSIIPLFFSFLFLRWKETKIKTKISYSQHWISPPSTRNRFLSKIAYNSQQFVLVIKGLPFLKLLSAKKSQSVQIKNSHPKRCWILGLFLMRYNIRASTSLDNPLLLFCISTTPIGYISSLCLVKDIWY